MESPVVATITYKQGPFPRKHELKAGAYRSIVREHGTVEAWLRGLVTEIEDYKIEMHEVHLEDGV